MAKEMRHDRRGQEAEKTGEMCERKSTECRRDLFFFWVRRRIKRDFKMECLASFDVIGSAQTVLS